ncbi:MAG TPA: hypothetical protein VHA37_00480 [Candidatus Saccharimonadales bacterium]|jgi:hypothetical protein|nr:hypothetical protein [Candidatus Saccharimonadales bacterium]
MLGPKKSILGAALLAGLVAAAVATTTQSTDARPVWRPHGHWLHTWHAGHYGWWWAGPEFWYWYPAPVYYGYPPPPDYIAPLGPAPRPAWYYCDSAKGYYPYVRSCTSGWRVVAANTQGQGATGETPPLLHGVPDSQDQQIRSGGVRRESDVG